MLTGAQARRCRTLHISQLRLEMVGMFTFSNLGKLFVVPN